MIRTKNADYSSHAIQKFRRIVERNFFKKKTLEFYEKVEDNRINTDLVVKLYELKNCLNVIFPDSLYSNIGQKVDFLEKNVYINEYYREIYAKGQT